MKQIVKTTLTHYIIIYITKLFTASCKNQRFLLFELECTY